MDFMKYQLDVVQRHLNKRIDGGVYVVSVDVQRGPGYSDIVIRLPYRQLVASCGLYVHLYSIDSVKRWKKCGDKYLCEGRNIRWYFRGSHELLKYNILCDSPSAAVKYVRYSLSNNWKFNRKSLDELVDFFDLEVNVRW